MSEWLENDRFIHVRDRVRDLCIEWNLPIPLIQKNDYCERCESGNDYDLIRIHCNQEGWKNPFLRPSYEDHARHVFLRYVCNLEQTEVSDRIIETIQERINW